MPKTLSIKLESLNPQTIRDAKALVAESTDPRVLKVCRELLSLNEDVERAIEEIRRFRQGT